MATLIKTKPYTSSSADNRGFQQAATINSTTDAIDFGNVTMTIQACLSHLLNNGFITFPERSKLHSLGLDACFNKIMEFEKVFKQL